MNDSRVRNKAFVNAFVATELVAVVVVAIVFLGVTIAASAGSRRLGGLNRDLANLRQIGAWTFAYGNDNADLYPTLSSAPNTKWAQLRPTGNQPNDAAKHAIDIIRRRTGRGNFPLPTGWLPNVLYSHLVLADYLDLAIPDSRFVSSGDVHRMRWLDDPINKHDRGFWQPFQNPQGASGPVWPSQKRWPFSSSYQTPPALFDAGQHQWRVRHPVVSQDGLLHNHYSVPSQAVLGGQNMSGIAFPAQKVLLHDYASWYTSRWPQYFAVETSAVSVLMSDGAAAMRTTRDVNIGWDPREPYRRSPTRFSYMPRDWEPPTTDGTARELLIGYYRWTRGGIRGRDFDGPEIDTGQR